MTNNLPVSQCKQILSDAQQVSSKDIKTCITVQRKEIMQLLINDKQELKMCTNVQPINTIKPGKRRFVITIYWKSEKYLFHRTDRTCSCKLFFSVSIFLIGDTKYPQLIFNPLKETLSHVCVYFKRSTSHKNWLTFFKSSQIPPVSSIT